MNPPSEFNDPFELRAHVTMNGTSADKWARFESLARAQAPHLGWRALNGFVRLSFDGSQVLGAYCRTSAKRISKTRKKTFEWIAHKLAPEVELPYEPGRPLNPTSDEILSAVMEYIGRCKKELPKQFVDDSRFLRVAAFIDWKALWTEPGPRRSNATCE